MKEHEVSPIAAIFGRRLLYTARHMMERVENARRNPAEAELETELRRYETARSHAEGALAELLENADLGPEDERVFLTEKALLLHADVLAVIHDQEGVDAVVLGSKLQELARQLVIRRHPDTAGLKRKKHQMQEEADAARERLAELRTARRARVEELRGVINRLNEGADLDRAVDECCALMEEEIGSLRANGDEHMASMVSASLEVVRGFGSGARKVELTETDAERARHIAHTVVSALVIQGKIGKGDVRFAERLAAELVLGDSDFETDEDALVRAVVTEVSGKNRGATLNVRHIDEKRAFVDPA